MTRGTPGTVPTGMTRGTTGTIPTGTTGTVPTGTTGTVPTGTTGTVPTGTTGTVPTGTTGTVPTGTTGTVPTGTTGTVPTGPMTRGTTGTVPTGPARQPLLDRVNPVTRLAAAMILSLPLLITLDWVSATSVVVIEIVVWLILQPRRAQAARTLALHGLPFLIAAPLAGVSMALYGSPGGRTHFTWGLITVSDQSISYGAAVAARVVALGTACLVTMTGVDPTDMADGLAQVWRLPARFVLGALAGVRLVGRLMADWRSLRLARRARGLGDHKAVRRFAGLAFALLVAAIRRGSALATAMEARGFGRGSRTWARPSRVGAPDAVYLVVVVLIVVAGLVISLVTGDFRWIGQVL